jgi:PST family polysaccharide transporter
MFHWGIFATIIYSISFFIGLPYGPNGVALSYSFAVLALAWPCVAYACHGTPLATFKVFKVTLVPIVASITSALSISIINNWIHTTNTNGLHLVVNAGSFISIYLLIIILHPHYRELVNSLIHKMVKNNEK